MAKTMGGRGPSIGKLAPINQQASEIRRLMTAPEKFPPEKSGSFPSAIFSALLAYLKVRVSVVSVPELNTACRSQLSHKNGLVPFATAHHMTHAVGILHSSLPWDGSTMSQTSTFRQLKNTP
jgi:hypothetical protein